MTKRMQELLLEAGKALLDGRDPFSDAFLSEHKVTFMECRTLSKQMATAVIGYTSGDEFVQAEVEGSCGAHLTGLDAGAVLRILRGRRASKMLEELK
jgi:hypothetical protein